jgi:aspartate/methionine/tyrosine aminotransferase
MGRVPVDLTISNPTRCDLPYPPDLLLPLADPAGLDYRPDALGPESTRRAVAAVFRRWNLDIDPSSIMLTGSTSEAYSLLFKLLCDPGDTVLVPTPSYPLFDQLTRLDGVAARPFALEASDDWRPDLDRMAAAPHNTRAVILVHPNNPTGSHVHPDDAAAVEALCRERGWALIVDEVFLPYRLDGGPGSLRSFADGDGCLSFTLGGLSKMAGLPQVKLAWVVVGGPDREKRHALERLDYIADAYLSVNTPVALAAQRLIASTETVQAAISGRCRRNLETLRSAAAEAPAVTVPRVGGGWSALVRLPAIIDDEELALQLLTDHGVAVQPGFFFDLPDEGTFVLSLLTPEPVWRRGLSVIFDTVGSWS